MKWPWTKRRDDAKADTERARHQYEWAVQNRVTVNSLVTRLVQHGETNQIVEMIHRVAKGRP